MLLVQNDEDGKEVNEESGKKSPKLKNGFSHPEAHSNVVASEESNSEPELEIPVKQKEGIFSSFFHI